MSLNGRQNDTTKASKRYHNDVKATTQKRHHNDDPKSLTLNEFFITTRVDRARWSMIKGHVVKRVKRGKKIVKIKLLESKRECTNTGVGSMENFQHTFYGTEFIWHYDWLKNLSSQSVCFKKCHSVKFTLKKSL